MTPKIIYLQHPNLSVPAEAQRVGYYYENGRAVGLVLQFPDGQRASLTYQEIERLRTAVAAPEAAV